MNDRVLVLGATGTVGGHLARRLEARGLPVRAATRRPEQAPARAGVEWVALDLARPETFAPALQGVRSVFLVARPGDEHADEVGLPFVRAMREAGVRHVVNLTAMGAEVAGHVPALRRIELALEASGMAFTHLRPNFFMQLFSTPPLQPAIRGGGALRLPAGDARLSFVDARDIAAVAEAALTSPAHRGRAYTLTGDEALDHAAVARAIAEATGRPVRYEALDEATAARELAAAGFPAARIERLARFYRLVRGGACAPVSSDVRDVLGRPALSFARFARDHRAAWS